jgi:hypothetical protein
MSDKAKELLSAPGEALVAEHEFLALEFARP